MGQSGTEFPAQALHELPDGSLYISHKGILQGLHDCIALYLWRWGRGLLTRAARAGSRRRGFSSGDLMAMRRRLWKTSSELLSEGLKLLDPPTKMWTFLSHLFDANRLSRKCPV